MCFERFQIWTSLGLGWGHPFFPNICIERKSLAASYVLSVFKPSVVYLNCVDKSAAEIATLIAEKLRKREAPPPLPGQIDWSEQSWAVT